VQVQVQPSFFLESIYAAVSESRRPVISMVFLFPDGSWVIRQEGERLELRQGKASLASLGLGPGPGGSFL
jgi:hypothetical protein